MITTTNATEDFLKATITKQDERINDLVLHAQNLAQRDYETAGTLQRLRDDMFDWTMNALEFASINETEAEAIANICGFELSKEFELEVTVQYSVTCRARDEESALNLIHDIDFDSISYPDGVEYISASVDRIEV
jgi:hypothetical protein